MYKKLVTLVSVITFVLAQKWHGPLAGGEPADKYPAGISPHACPNFPHCANPAVAVQPSTPYVHAYHKGDVNQKQTNTAAHDPWNNHPNPLDRGEYVGDGDYKGEGLPESGAYGPHYSWNMHQTKSSNVWNASPQYATGHQTQLPAGVSAHACPNYPFCH